MDGVGGTSVATLRGVEDRTAGKTSPDSPPAPDVPDPEEARRQRRARREARRERQRAQNVVRAEQMHVARVAYEGDRSSRTRPAAGEDDTLPAVNVGCSGWFYWHWRDCFYPEGSPSSQWFDFYASKFRTVELNAPFYSWPTVATVKTWVRQAGRRRFVYAVKVNELITHQKRFVGTGRLVRDFGFIGDLLGRRLGCFLFQLPPSFRYSPAALKRVLGQLDQRHRNVVEFRHRSWWNERVFAAFRDANAIFCSCSGPRLPDELVRTADDVYVRFHGTKRWYRHDYSKAELAVWAGRIRSSGARRVWAYFNNDREGYAIKNARELLRQLKAG
jgi:uncharacterized protein YecE (DUF72 family)